MESSELKKQKRLGPAPIASFEKSFEDNTLPQGNISPTLFENNTNLLTGESSNGLQLHNLHMDGKAEQCCQKDLNTVVNYQQQQPIISVSDSIPSKKLHGIGKKIYSLQAISDGDSGSGGVGNEIKIMTSETKGLTLGLKMSSTPRIDISRASSSSHHDSRDSSPENVFEQVGTGTLQEAIGIGFREEGTLDLRSSTEELYFMDPEQKKEEQEKMQQSRKSPVIFKFDEHQTYLQQHQRKDSASSEVAALLCISGRTSRISSVGSQGSAISRLSAISGVSRSPSPHRMLLETSFCGPKPLENVVDGSVINTVEPPTAEALEQILLSRKHDPTQAVLAEGIQIETTPRMQQKKVFKDTSKIVSSSSDTEKISKVLSTSAYKSSIPSNKKGSTITPRNDSGKQVVGVTPSGTEYIRIKLKPDHMYEDYGLGPNERIVDISGASSGIIQKKPATLSLGRDIRMTEQRLTPSSSPKLNKHAALAKDIGGSRSPSPATATVSRKSSFCSLFKTKDSPDSPRDRSRSRSKSRDRLTPQSQTETPSKQKSVLAIFKPKRSGSKSKCSSPVDQETLSQLDGISQVEFKFKSDTNQDPPSRPSSRLKYYDIPLDGKSIHIPLHTPPEEKHDQKFTTSKGAQEQEPLSFSVEPLTNSISKIEASDQAPTLPPKFPKPSQLEKFQKIENVGAVHNLPEDIHEKERTWSLEVQRHSSQESPEIASETLTGQKLSKLTDVVESQLIKNGTASTISQINVPSTITQATAQQLESPKKEKRRLLFATKLGSGSEEQIFSTQFSLSKTESLSSQLSEQTIPESPAFEGNESLHRTDTVIRRVEESSFTTAVVIKKQEISEGNKQNDCILYDSNLRNQKQEFGRDSQMKSKSIFEQEQKKKQSVVVTMRKKDSLEETKWKSKTVSEDDDNSQRHSRYVENFDIKKKFQGNTTKTLQSGNNSTNSIKEIDSCISQEEDDKNIQSLAPIITTKSKHSDLASTLSQSLTERQSVISTDEPIESSESEGDSEMDPNRIKRHLTRHIGVIEDHESAGLVSQDSFEDEFPYVPTTLPEERAHGVSLIPMKERANMELKMYSVDRPRSTTPMNPACLEEYCGIATPDDVEHIPIRGEKLRISLPRKDHTKDRTKSTKSPRRISNDSSKSWFEFAEQGIKSQQQSSTPSIITTKKHEDLDETASLHNEEPPPLPPRKLSGAIINQWINFENIPEKRKPPKRITALPKEPPQELSKIQSIPPTIHYNYVKPEECQCECHEIERESTTHNTITNIDLLQQGEDMQPLLEPESQEGIDPSDSSLDYDAGAPDIQDTKTFEKKPTKQTRKS